MRELGRFDIGHKRADTVPRLQQALIGQPRQNPAQRRARDTEFCGQRFLAQFGAGRVIQQADARAQGLVEGLMAKVRVAHAASCALNPRSMSRHCESWARLTNSSGLCACAIEPGPQTTTDMPIS